MNQLIYKTTRLTLLFFGSLFLGLSAEIKAQNFEWARQISGTDGEACYDIAADPAGNVYSTGWFAGTVDFDPGPGSYYLTSNGMWDIFICKFNPSGNLIWVRQMGDSSYDSAISLALDGNGNIYTTGDFQGTVDFDPGPSVFNLTSSGAYDVFISKLDSSGNFLWAGRLGSSNWDRGFSVAVDNAGNPILSGYFSGPADFDPSPATYILTPNGANGINDAFLCKLDASGNFVWARSFGGAGLDWGYSVALDGNNNVYAIGTYNGVADFDPGPNTFNLTSNGYDDIFITKLDEAGVFVWAKSIGGDSVDYGSSIAVDSIGQVYYCGKFNKNVDFDPGVGAYYLNSLSSAYACISKLDAAGNLSWVKQFIANDFIIPSALALGHSSNIYTTGWFSDTVDFDPGAGTFQVSPGNFLAGAFVLKLSTSGQFVWARYIGGTIGLGISVSDSGKIYTTGQFQDTSDFDPSASIYPLIAYGSTDAFIHKMNQGQGYNQQIMNLVGTCFPNPVTQYLTVVLNNASEIEIYSNTGILLKTYPAKKEHLVDVSGYNAGLFFIKTPNGALKFVK